LTCVALRAGAWIETNLIVSILDAELCRPPRGGAD